MGFTGRLRCYLTEARLEKLDKRIRDENNGVVPENIKFVDWLQFSDRSSVVSKNNTLRCLVFGNNSVGSVERQLRSFGRLRDLISHGGMFNVDYTLIDLINNMSAFIKNCQSIDNIQRVDNDVLQYFKFDV